MLQRIAIILMLVVVSACSEEVPLYSEHIPEGVCYAVISPDDTVHTIRLQRTFQTDHGDYSQLPQEALYFSDVSGRIRGYRNGELKWERPLQEVIIEKDSGIFPVDQHLVYRFYGKIREKTDEADEDHPRYIDQIKLHLYIPELGDTARSESYVPAPTILRLDRYDGKRISCYGDQVSKIQFQSAYSAPINSENSYTELGFKFYFREFIDGVAKQDSVIHISKDVDLAIFNNGGYLLTPDRLFNRLMMGITLNPDVTSRVLDSIHFFTRRTNGAFADYWDTRINRSDHDFPPFSNIENLYGMFFCISKGYSTGYYLDMKSADSLANGEKWKHLKFRFY